MNRKALKQVQILQWMTFGLAMLMVTLLALAQEPKRPTPIARLKASYVGSKICFECHLDVARVWASLPHSQWMLSEKLPSHLRGCEACHGPGSYHVIVRKGNIVSWESLSTADRNSICLQCHEKVTDEKWLNSPHGKGTRGKGQGDRETGRQGEKGEGRKGEKELPSCVDCHEVHLPVKQRWMLKALSQKLCLKCHGDIAVKAKAGLHHPIAKALPKCTACHDAHDGTNAGMLKVLPMALCRRCHDIADIKPADHTPAFVKEHGKSVKMDDRKCSSCHGRDGCFNCHGIEMPHPRGFIVKHANAVFSSPSVCARCHDTAFCGKCHSDVPPASHEERGYAGKGHSLEIKQRSQAYCSLCHQPRYCDDCHRRKGVPLRW